MGIWGIISLLRLSMARLDFRELLAWALFAAVTAFYVHSTSQLELCMAQLEISHADMRVSTSFLTGGDSGPRNQGNVGLSNEPSDALAFVTALPDVRDSVHVDTASGATCYKPI